MTGASVSPAAGGPRPAPVPKSPAGKETEADRA